MATWDTLAPTYIRRLAQDVQISPEQSAGIFGQLGHESGLQAINERNPVVPGSRGGFGWAQWTGPRRRAFESWVADNKTDVTDPEANYQFLLHELTATPEGRVLDAVRAAPDAQAAGRAFTDQFLRPGIPAYDSRASWTERALNFVLPSAQAGTLPENQKMSMAERIQKARDAGFNDEEIMTRLQNNADMAQRIQKARDAGFTDEEIFGRMGLSGVATPPADPGGAAPGRLDGVGGGVLAGIGMGLRDPIDAGAQMLRRAVPEGVGKSIDAFGNRLADMGLPVARSEGVEGVDAAINQRDAQYQAARQAVGRDGMDWARLGGNIAGITPMMAAMPAGGAGMAGRMLAGGAQGAVAGAMAPVIGEQAQQDFGGEKSGQALLGGAFGAAAPAVIGGVARMVSPRASLPGSPAQTLAREGVELTPGQALGGAIMRAEDRAMSIPIMGDAIRGARSRANESLNRAVYNRVLEPIGKSTSKSGREAVDDAVRFVSQAYDDVLAKVRFVPDNEFTQNISQLRGMAQNLPAREARAFDQVLQREVIEPLTKGRWADGQTFKRVESQLGERAQQFLRATDAYQNDVGRALLEVQKSLRESLSRMNPSHAKELRSVNTAYANLVRMENAAGRIGAHDGVFTPQQLAQAIRQSDRSVRKRAYSRGGALMQDLSDAAQSRMSAQVPDSGTPERLMAAALAGGAGYMASPAIPAALAAGAIPYLPGLSKAATSAIMSRPSTAQDLARALRALPPGYLGLLAGTSD